jgi:hypothetical protein
MESGFSLRSNHSRYNTESTEALRHREIFQNPLTQTMSIPVN